MANEIARALRKRMTPQEVRLWLRLRALKPLGFHFRRQAPRVGAIVDFACVSARLVVEVDGGQHGLPHEVARDGAREARLAAAGYRVLRFWNSDIDRNLDGVVATIHRALFEATPPGAAARRHPPRAGEGEGHP